MHLPDGAAKMDEAQAARITSSWFEMCKVFTGNLRAQMVFLGDDDAVSYECRRFVVALDRTGDLMDHKGRDAKWRAGILWCIHLLTFRWVEEQQVRKALPVLQMQSKISKCGMPGEYSETCTQEEMGLGCLV
jgi:hypothetical protein